MSFTDRLVLSVHIAFVIFTIGPVTAAIMSTPRAIRNRNPGLLRYLLRTTRIFGAASLGILVFGIILGGSERDLGKAWLTVSTTLFVVALVLLVLVMRDQRRALAALTASQGSQAQPGEPQQTGAQPSAPAGAADGERGTPAGTGQAAITPAGTTAVATVERGRIASLGGVISLIWLAILVLMVWQP